MSQLRKSVFGGSASIVNRANERGYRIEEFSIFGEKDAARLGSVLWNPGID